MHLSSPALTLTRSKKPKFKLTKAKLKEYEIDMRAFNKDRKKYGERAVTMDEYIRIRTGRVVKDKSFKTIKMSDTMQQRLSRIDSYKTDYKSLNSATVAGATPKVEPLVYSGERKLLGIATMHKSNMVPVFDSDDAKDIARMRRN